MDRDTITVLVRLAVAGVRQLRRARAASAPQGTVLPRYGSRPRAGGRTAAPSYAGSMAPVPAWRPTQPYAGDFTGRPHIDYDPSPGDTADPGEVVWAWVPYEEDHSRGKDRPVLVIGREEDLLLAVPLTSKDHDRDAEQEAQAGRHWVDVGPGTWDLKGRPSEARVDRILRLRDSEIRRMGAVLDRRRFDDVAEAIVARRGGWRG